jgi:hypothetical protein
MVKKLTLLDCQNIAVERGGKCLSEEYNGNKEKMKWSCKEEHIWSACFNHIKNNKSWCPDCSGNKKLTIEECQLFAKNKGGECLSEEYIKHEEKMKWKCKEGHIWYAHFSNIKNNKTWCVECSYNNKKLTIEECQLFAKNKGGECLSEKYNNCYTKMSWKCSKGHIWNAIFTHIKNNKKWCPNCSHSRSEKLTRSIFEELTGLFFPSIRPDFLKNPETNCNLELDGYCDDLKLAFEYQGQQHYEFLEHFHKTPEDFINRQKLDRLKLKLCKDHEISVILIPYTFSYKNESDLRVFIKDSLIPFGFE